METQSLIEKRKQYLFDANRLYYDDPIHLVRAKGRTVWDSEGREYLDAIGGIVSISVGHNHPKIQAKLKQMLEDDAIQHTTHLYLSMYMVELAEKLATLAPGDISQCYFTNSGSEANEMAILTARVATGHQMVIALRHGYHGGTGTALSLCGVNTWKYPSGALNGGVAHAEAPYCYRCPYGAEPDTCSLECAEDVKRAILTSTHGEIAAVIVEPIMGVGGFLDAPVSYHKRVKEIVGEHGGLYISDEVQTGLGRTGKNFFAIEDSDVAPDMITMAKGLGNGAPIGALLTKPELAKSIGNKLHFNTFGGDPFQAQQASAVIDLIHEENLIENARLRGEWLNEQLHHLQEEFPVIGDVRGRGLMQAIELVTDHKKKVPATAEAKRLLNLCKEEGLLLGTGGLYGNTVRMAPPMSLTQPESESIIARLKAALNRLN